MTAGTDSAAWLRVPVLARSLYAATCLALVHVTVQTFRDSAAQAGHYPDWVVVGARAIVVTLALWMVVSTVWGGRRNGEEQGVLHLSSLQALVASAIVVGAVSAVTATDLAGQAGMPWQLHLFVIASSLAVLALGMRLGMVAVVVIWVEFLLLRAPRDPVQAFAEAAAFLASGVFCGAAIYVVRRGARLVARAEGDRAQIRERTGLVHLRQEASEWWDRFIHDTVLGALLLAGRRPTDDRDSSTAATEMARDAIDALHGRRPARSAGTAHALLTAHAHSLGLSVTGSVRDDGAPPLVREEIVDAAKEAITNVARHAGTRAVVVDGVLSADAVNLWVTDDGKGFDPGRATDRLGVRDGLERRMAVLGGSAAVESTPGDGTTVHLSWQADAPERAGVTWPQEPYSALVVPLVLYGSLHAVAGILFDRSEGDGLIAIGAVLLIAMVTITLDRRVPDRWALPVVATLPFVVGALTTLIEPMTVPDFRTWYVGASSPIAIALVIRGWRRAAVALAVVTSGSFLLAGHLAGTVPLGIGLNVSAQVPIIALGAVAISLTLDRSAQHILRLNRQNRAAEAALAAVRARESERRARLDELASEVEPLLRRVASGTGLSEADRLACRQVEARVRDGLTGRALLSGVVRGAVAQARERGASVIVTSTDGAALPQDLWPVVNDAVARCAQVCTTGSSLTVRLVGTAEEGRCTVALFGPERALEPAGHRALGADIEESQHEDSVLITVQWPAADSGEDELS